MRGENKEAQVSNRLRTLLLFSVLLLLAAVPADAANTSLDSYVVQSQPYTPYPVFVLTLGIGLMFLIMSLILSNDQNNDAFAALAIIPLFASSWMALQLDFPMSGVAGTVENSVFRTDHLIYPQSILAVVLFALGCIAVFQLYRLMTANKPGNMYDDNWQEKEYRDY
jgi:hypothetical protein